MTEIERKHKARSLVVTLTQNVEKKKFDTNEEVFAYHKLISFLSSMINSQESSENLEEEELKLRIFQELVEKNIFYSYRAIYEILISPKAHLNKMFPFLFCFREYLEQKEILNSCDEEKMNCLKEALLLKEINSVCRTKNNSFCQMKQNEI